MGDQCDPDLSLFGDWPELPVYGQQVPMLPHACAAPEMKSVVSKAEDGSGVELRVLLNAMTRELREQFELFRLLREGAQKQVDSDTADEAAQKMLRADAKAAADAVSLIVRTLEKIDGLQRQLARDRDEMADREAESKPYSDARTFFLERIEALAEERARVMVESSMTESKG